jgi:hypothetical protein
MSPTSRARKLSALTHISYQQAVQHLARLALGIRDEKEYVNSLRGGGLVHSQTCACGSQFFTLSASATVCPRCTNERADQAGRTAGVVLTTATPAASVAPPAPSRDGWMQQHAVKPGRRANPWRIFSPKRLPPGRKVSRLGWSSAWDDYFPSASWLDHSEVWMKGGRAVCVTGQPYVLDERAHNALALLREAGAEVHVHEPEAMRSWHNPGHCYLIEVWRPASLAPRPLTKAPRWPRPPGKATVLASRPASKRARGTAQRETVHAVLFAHGRPTAKSPFGRKGGMTVCGMGYPGASVEYLSLTDDAPAVTCPKCNAVLANGGWSQPDSREMCRDCDRYPHEGHLPRCRFVKMYGMRLQTRARVE